MDIRNIHGRTTKFEWWHGFFGFLYIFVTSGGVSIAWACYQRCYQHCCLPNTCSAREQRLRDSENSEKADKRPPALYWSLDLLPTEHILLGPFVPGGIQSTHVTVTEFLNVVVTPSCESNTKMLTLCINLKFTHKYCKFFISVKQNICLQESTKLCKAWE